MRIPLLALSVVLAACSVRAESIGLKPFPELSAPRAVTGGPHDHFLANYFAINAWSPDNRYLLVLETDEEINLHPLLRLVLSVTRIEVKLASAEAQSWRCVGCRWP